MRVGPGIGPHWPHWPHIPPSPHQTLHIGLIRLLHRPSWTNRVGGSEDLVLARPSASPCQTQNDSGRANSIRISFRHTHEQRTTLGPTGVLYATRTHRDASLLDNENVLVGATGGYARQPRKYVGYKSSDGMSARDGGRDEVAGPERASQGAASELVGAVVLVRGASPVRGRLRGGA